MNVLLEFLRHNLNYQVLTSFVLQFQDSWDLDDDEEKKDEEKSESAPAPAKPKRKIQDKIAEREVSFSSTNTTAV